MNSSNVVKLRRNSRRAKLIDAAKEVCRLCARDIPMFVDGRGELRHEHSGKYLLSHPCSSRPIHELLGDVPDVATDDV